MDSADEDVSARIILKNVLYTERTRTPLTHRASQAQITASMSRCSVSLYKNEVAARLTPGQALKLTMKQKLLESSSKAPIPPSKRRTMSSVVRKMNMPAPTTASLLYDDDITPRHLLKGILRTEPEMSLLVQDQHVKKEIVLPSADSSLNSNRSSFGLSGLDLPDLTVDLANTVNRLSRKRPHRSLDVSMFEKKLGHGDDVEKEDSADDLSGMSSTSLSLKTPCMDARTEKRGLQRKVANRRKVSVEEFDANVQSRQTVEDSELNVRKALQVLGETAHSEGFTLGMSDLAEPDITNDIVISNTALYAPTVTMGSSLSITTQDTSATQIQKGREVMDSEKEREREPDKVLIEIKNKFELAEKADQTGEIQEEDMGFTYSHTEKEAVDSQTKDKAAAESHTDVEEEADSQTDGEEAADSQTDGEEAADSQTDGEEAADSQTDGEVVAQSQTDGEEAAQSQIDGEEAADSQTDEEVVAQSQTDGEEAAQSQIDRKEAADSQTDGEVVAQSQTDGEEAAQSQIDGEEAADSQTDGEVVAQSQTDGEEAAQSQIDRKEAADSQTDGEVVAQSQIDGEEATQSQTDGEEAADSQTDGEEAEESQTGGKEAVESHTEEEEPDGSQTMEHGAAIHQSAQEEPTKLHFEREDDWNEGSKMTSQRLPQDAEHTSHRAYHSDWWVRKHAVMEGGRGYKSMGAGVHLMGVTDGLSGQASEGDTAGKWPNGSDVWASGSGQPHMVTAGSAQISLSRHRGALEEKSPSSGETSPNLKKEGISMSPIKLTFQVENNGLSSSISHRLSITPQGPAEHEEWDDVDEDGDETDQSQELLMKTPIFVREKRRLVAIEPAHTGPKTNMTKQVVHISAGNAAAVKPKTVRTKQPTSAKKQTGLPKTYLMSVFKHFAKTKVSADVYPILKEVMDKYFDRLADDLETFAAHAKRKTIEVEDVELLLRRQGFVTDTMPVNVLIEKYLPMEYRKLLIPVATSGNHIVPKLRR